MSPLPPIPDVPLFVSVVIPTKGRADIVTRAVTSALSQTFREIEVIVIVDGDDPETASTLGLIHDSRLHVVVLPASVGGAAARNVGVRRARADWVAFLDDDDMWLPKKLEVQLQIARQASVQFPVVCCAYLARSGAGDALFGRKAPQIGQPISEYMFCRESLSYGENALATSVLFVPRALMLLVPFDPALKRHQDWDWALRALSVPGSTLLYASEPLSIYSMPDGLERVSSHTDWQSSLAWCRARKALFTPRAVSFFVATECLTRAREAHAGVADLLALIRAYWQEGQPTFRSLRLVLLYCLVPKRLRRALLKLVS